MSLESMIEIRDCIRELCAAIDKGEINTTDPEFEKQMLFLGIVATEYHLHDELFMLGARCKHGQAVLKKIAQ